jgi:hypothetical protein
MATKPRKDKEESKRTTGAQTAGNNMENSRIRSIDCDSHEDEEMTLSDPSSSTTSMDLTSGTNMPVQGMGKMSSRAGSSTSSGDDLDQPFGDDEKSNDTDHNAAHAEHGKRKRTAPHSLANSNDDNYHGQGYGRQGTPNYGGGSHSGYGGGSNYGGRQGYGSQGSYNGQHGGYDNYGQNSQYDRGYEDRGYERRGPQANYGGSMGNYSTQEYGYGGQRGGYQDYREDQRRGSQRGYNNDQDYGSQRYERGMSGSYVGPGYRGGQGYGSNNSRQRDYDNYAQGSEYERSRPSRFDGDSEYNFRSRSNSERSPGYSRGNGALYRGYDDRGQRGGYNDYGYRGNSGYGSQGYDHMNDRYYNEDQGYDQRGYDDRSQRGGYGYDQRSQYERGGYSGQGGYDRNYNERSLGRYSGEDPSYGGRSGSNRDRNSGNNW